MHAYSTDIYYDYFSNLSASLLPDKLKDSIFFSHEKSDLLMKYTMLQLSS